MSATMRRRLREYEKYEYERGYTDKELEAAELRKDFLRKHLINFDVNLYKTLVERDWAYIAKREYNWDVKYKSWGYGFFVGNIAWSAAIWWKKRFVFWPLPVFGILGSLYYQPKFFQMHNKKLFDMCNVGEQYFFGKKRNEVLRECNRILDREDF